MEAIQVILIVAVAVFSALAANYIQDLIDGGEK